MSDSFTEDIQEQLHNEEAQETSEQKDHTTEELISLMSKIKQIANVHPTYQNVILTDLYSILNKFDPRCAQNPFPLVPADAKIKGKNVKDKIFQSIGKAVKIPSLRFEADKLSQELGIPLPNSTRKHNEALMQWFDDHWDIIQPRLLAHKDEIR